MRIASFAALSTAVLLFFFAPAFAQAQEDMPPGTASQPVPTEAPIPSVLPVMTPHQKITDQMVRIIEGESIVHGPNMEAYISRELWKTKPTTINPDCAGHDAETAAATAAGAPVPPPIVFSKRVYGRKNIDLYVCNLPGPDRLAKKLPLPPAVRRVYHRRKVQAMLKACRFVARAARKGQPTGQRVRVSCKHLKAVGSNSNLTVLQYYGRGHSKKKILAISLQSDGQLLVRKRDIVTVDIYPNRQL